MIIDREQNKIDYRHTVDIYNSITFADAIQVNDDGTYESVTYMIDDVRTFRNEAIIDATKEELEAYRIYCRRFQKGDVVVIARGRKMRGELKVVEKTFRYYVDGTYNQVWSDYLVFDDGTKVQKQHCDFVMA